MSDAINFNIPDPNHGDNIPADMLGDTRENFTPENSIPVNHGGNNNGKVSLPNPMGAYAAEELPFLKSAAEAGNANESEPTYSESSAGPTEIAAPAENSTSAAPASPREASAGASAAPASNSEGRPADRRRRRRALISAPVRVRGVHVTNGGPDEISTTMDVSRIGILFATKETSYFRGMDVAVTFPYSKAPTAIHAEQHGRVARVHEMPDGRIAVAVALGLGVGEDLVDSCGRKLNKGTAPVPVSSFKREADSQKPLILVVDEDDAIRDTLKNYLENEGYEVFAVSNGGDGRELLNLYTPTLVIAEVEGEGLPGFDLCAHVKSTPRLRNIPVVLTTRSGNPTDYSNAHSLGAVVCMSKPYKQDRLGHVVRLLAPLPSVAALNAASGPRNADAGRRPGCNGNGTKSAPPGNGNGPRRFRFPSFR